MSDSEEKTQEPTEHKLRKSRQKGQISSSADFVTAMLTLAGVITVYLSIPSFIRLFSDLFTRAINSFNIANDALLKIQLLFIIKGLLTVIAPLAIILVTVAIVANILHKKGIPFSMHPIKPDFTRIDPAKGLKKLFASRNAIEFGVSLFRIIIWFITAISIILIWLPDLLSSPVCGAGCIVASITSIAQWLFIAGCILLIAFGLVDLPMQVMLFRKDQRMSHSEQKRERKDIDGSPEIKKKRRQLALENLAQAEQGKELRNTKGLLLTGNDCVVEVRFASGKTPLPIVVSKAKGDAAYDMLATARMKMYPIEDLGDTTFDIYSSVNKGMPIHQRHFSAVANALVKNNLV